jgi:hypothetical protein
MNPADHTRLVALLAGAEYQRSRRDVPMAQRDNRSVTYFGRTDVYGCFEDKTKRIKVKTPFLAALWLLGVVLPGSQPGRWTWPV